MFRKKQKNVYVKPVLNKTLNVKFEIELVVYDFNPEGELIKLTCNEKLACSEDTFSELTKRSVESHIFGIYHVPKHFDLEDKLYILRNYKVKIINALEFELVDKK